MTRRSPLSRLCAADRIGVSTLVLVWLGKFVGVTEYDLPLAVLSPVGLGAAKRSRLPAITDVSGHVLQIDCEGKILADRGDDVLCAPVGRGDALRRPVEPGAHLFPAAFMTPKAPMITTSSACDQSALKSSGRPRRVRREPLDTDTNCSHVVSITLFCRFASAGEIP